MLLICRPFLQSFFTFCLGYIAKGYELLPKLPGEYHSPFILKDRYLFNNLGNIAPFIYGIHQLVPLEHTSDLLLGIGFYHIFFG